MGRNGGILLAATFVVALVAGCGTPGSTAPNETIGVPSTPVMSTPTPTPKTTGASTLAPSTLAPATPTAMPTPGEEGPPGQMQVRIVSPADGASVPIVAGADGRGTVKIAVEVTSVAPIVLSMTANGLPALGADGKRIDFRDTDKTLPYKVAFDWAPASGGGAYELVVSGMDDQKTIVTTTIHITVTGAAHVTLPPKLSEAAARAKFHDLVMHDYNVSIPKPSMHRFDSQLYPAANRWIVAAYYQGVRYYANLFDDGRVDLLPQKYADPRHRIPGAYLCRPAGDWKVLVVFVDYGNTGATKADALAQVPVVTDWLNGMYDRFAKSQGFATSPLHVSSEGAWLSPPPKLYAPVTSDQIRELTGKDPTAFDFVIQIDLDVHGGWGAHENPGEMPPGGGFAGGGCANDAKFAPLTVWSSLPDARTDEMVRGGLVMDFNHELSHTFGMLDDWPAITAVKTGPLGSMIDDWIPYDIFGWTDTDGDHIPEIIDPTPYGTTGPKP